MADSHACVCERQTDEDCLSNLCLSHDGAASLSTRQSDQVAKPPLPHSYTHSHTHVHTCFPSSPCSIVCRENGGECKRDADAVRKALGLRSTTDPLFQIDKVFAKVKNMDLDPDKLEDFFTATEDWNTAMNMSNSMAFISQFGVSTCQAYANSKTNASTVCMSVS